MNILHLSDIHFGRNYPRYGIMDNFQKHDEILNELIRVIADMDESLRPEHIVFTGDIVWQGKTDEYKEALEWFRRLLSSLNLTGKDISFCVGNHDLDLSCRCDDPSIGNRSVDKIDEYYKYENIHKLDFPLYGYYQFCREIGTEPYAYPVNGELRYSYSAGYKDIVFKNGKTLRLLSFNTAQLFSFKNISSDKMWLGLEQIKSLRRHGILPAPKDIWYTMALCHHSDRFLHPDETSTYNGRPATLPMLLEHVNLILCGHTESSGKSRLSKQSGGGSMLCGGAAYYSDDHINTFSMVFLSDSRRTMGFLPYIYDNGWKDYDFEPITASTEEQISLVPEETYMENTTLIFESGPNSFRIDCKYLTLSRHEDENGSYTILHNKKDVQNPFLIEYDSRNSSVIRVSPAPGSIDSVRTNLFYRKYTDFVNRSHPSVSSCCRIYDSFGEERLTIPSFRGTAPCLFDRQFLQELRKLERTFHVHFRLPDCISESDLNKVRLLKQLSETGYAHLATLSSKITKTFSYDDMKELYNTARKDNHFYLRYEKGCSIELFDVTLDLSDLTVYAAPFSIDMEDIRHKLDTFCPGDLRLCTFLPDPESKVYLTHKQTYLERINQKAVSDRARIQNIETIDLNIMI